MFLETQDKLDQCGQDNERSIETVQGQTSINDELHTKNQDNLYGEILSEVIIETVEEATFKNNGLQSKNEDSLYQESFPDATNKLNYVAISTPIGNNKNGNELHGKSIDVSSFNNEG